MQLYFKYFVKNSYVIFGRNSPKFLFNSGNGECALNEGSKLRRHQTRKKPKVLSLFSKALCFQRHSTFRTKTGVNYIVSSMNALSMRKLFVPKHFLPVKSFSWLGLSIGGPVCLRNISTFRTK